MRRKRHHTDSGTSFIEAIMGGLILIPLALCMLDLIVLVSATYINDGAAKTAARAAADQQTQPLAQAAAVKALADYRSTTLATITIAGPVVWNSDRVTVQTTADVHFPVPFPGFASKTLTAQATEPVIASPQ